MSRCVVCGLEIGLESEDLCPMCVGSARRYETTKSLDALWADVRIAATRAGRGVPGDGRKALAAVRDDMRRLMVLEQALCRFLLHEQACPRCENCGDAIDVAEAIVVGGKHYCVGHGPGTRSEHRKEAS